MTGKLKNLYFYFLITAVSGFAVGYAVKYYFHSFNIPGQYMVLFAPLIFILSAIFAVALPIYYRTCFAHSRRHLSEITRPELLKFERNLICMATVAPYLALIGYLLELPRFYLAGTTLLALYAVYYHYPSNKRMAFEKILSLAKGLDVIIFDMPPTALTMRFFSLPFITLIWLEALLKLRTQIYQKKEIIFKINIGKKIIEQDKVKAKLEVMIDSYRHLRDYFTSPKTKINLVVNNDRLSLSESVRIKQKLTEIGIPINRIVVNKTRNNEIADSLRAEFNGYKMVLFPLASGGLLGLETLGLYLDNNQTVLNELP